MTACMLLYPVLGAYLGASVLWVLFFLAQEERYCRLGAGLLAVGLGGHTLELLLRTWALGMLPAATLGGTLSIFAWTLVAAFLVLHWRYPIKVLGALVAPLAVLLVLGSLLEPGVPGQASGLPQSILLTLHIVLSFLGIAALSLAGLGGIFYLVQERQIKGKKFGFCYRRLPSLDQLDALNYWCLTVGFPFLTGGILLGSLYAQVTLGRFLSWDAKDLLTLMGWLIYAVLLHERLAVGWRGRKAALLALGAFIFLVVTFLGANLWLSGYHSFASFGRQP